MSRSWGRFETAVVNGVVTGDRRWCMVADRIAVEQNITRKDVSIAKIKIERWLRTRGILRMLPFEKQALLKLQSFFRKYLTRCNLWRKYAILLRLSSDSRENALKAALYYKVLTRT